jgi:hypothetical protein
MEPNEKNLNKCLDKLVHCMHMAAIHWRIAQAGKTANGKFMLFMLKWHWRRDSISEAQLIRSA